MITNIMKFSKCLLWLLGLTNGTLLFVTFAWANSECYGLHDELNYLLNDQFKEIQTQEFSKFSLPKQTFLAIAAYFEPRAVDNAKILDFYEKDSEAGVIEWLNSKENSEIDRSQGAMVTIGFDESVYIGFEPDKLMTITKQLNKIAEENSIETHCWKVAGYTIENGTDWGLVYHPSDWVHSNQSENNNKLIKNLGNSWYVTASNENQMSTELVVGLTYPIDIDARKFDIDDNSVVRLIGFDNPANY